MQVQASFAGTLSEAGRTAETSCVHASEVFIIHLGLQPVQTDKTADLG